MHILDNYINSVYSEESIATATEISYIPLSKATDIDHQQIAIT